MQNLINDDSYSLIKTMKDNSVDLIVTDPPYDLVKGAGKFRNNRKYYNEIDNISTGFDYDILNEMIRVMKHINIYIFCSKNQLLDLMNFFVNKHHCKWELISWHKTNPIPMCNNTYLHDTEYCIFFRDSNAQVYGEYKTKHTYYVTSTNTKDKKKYGHPTIKPLEIIKNFIINSSVENETVFDPFMGSGTTGVACKELNRNFIGIELDNTYFENAVTRINNT